MAINSKSKIKKIVFCAVAIIFLTISITSFDRFKRKIIHLLEDTREASNQARSLALVNNLLLNDYEVSPLPGTQKDFRGSLFFVGHIYPQSGYIDNKNSPYANKEYPLDFLRTLFRHTPPLRTIFGGDNVEFPTRGALRHILDLKSAIQKSRFILGNHDQYWEILKNHAVFEKIFHERYYYEDVNGIRLIYLHTVSEDGNYGLDDAQRTFLKEDALRGSYKYALIFLHHALWATQPVTNSPYPESEKIRDDWNKNILPILSQGRTMGVFSGDGGNLSPGSKIKLGTIWHYTTGWSMNRQDIPPEWLKIDLGEKRIQVYWQKLLAGKLFIKKDPTSNGPL